MRRLLLGVLLLAACSDDDGQPGADAAGGGADASAAADAAVVTPDAPGAADAGGDVLANCGTPTGQATVQLEAGAVLVVHCADGQPSAILHGTGADVQVDVVAGTMLTTIGGGEPVTILGVSPDDVVAPFGFGSGGGNQIASPTVTLPGAHPGAVNYIVDTGCFGQNFTSDPLTPVQSAVIDECSAADKFVVYATALDMNDVVIAYTFAVDVAVGGGSPMVTLPAWRTDFVAVPVHIINAPAAFVGGIGVAGATAGFGNGPSRFELTLADGDIDEIATGGSRDVVLSVPSAFAQRLIVTVVHGSFNQANPSDTTVHYRYRRVATIPEEMTFDLTADSLPLVHALAIDGSTPGRPELSWTETGSPAADAKLGHIQNANDGWTFLGPGNVTEFVVPVLPQSLAGSVLQPPYGGPAFISLDVDTLTDFGQVVAGGLNLAINFDGFSEPAGVDEYRLVYAGDM